MSIKARIIQRTDTEANWESVNPTLSSNELIFVQTPVGTSMKLGTGDTYLNTPFIDNENVFFASCSTPSATATKVISCDGIRQLSAG
jgi:hypothetical protein